MSLITPILAPLKGLELCLTDPDVRRASLLPWMAGGIVAILASGILVYAFPAMTDYMAHHVTDTIVIGSQLIAWIATSLLSILFAAIITMVVVLVFCSYYHYRIAQLVLTKRGFQLKELTALKEIGRSSLTEILKLTWLIPLYLIVFVIGLIPIFTPFAFLGWGMLAAYQFLDYPLDTLHYGAFGRLGFVLKHLLGATLFGVTLVLISAIPFAIFFITPVAVAGGSWLVSEMGWVKSEAQSALPK